MVRAPTPPNSSASNNTMLQSGAGPIGLVSLLAAHAAGAAPIVITDMFQSRLDFAKKLIPRVHTVLVQKNDSPKQLAKKIEAAAGGKLQITLECTGVESSISSAIYVRSDVWPLLSLTECPVHMAGHQVWRKSFRYRCRKNGDAGKFSSCDADILCS